MKKRNRNSSTAAVDSARHYGAIADAARAMQIKSSWGRAMKRASTGGRPKDGVKLHAGWDAAFRRARGG